MKLAFHKYQGTGNDFILVDNRNLFFPLNDQALIAKLCDRRFGIGADGLILVEEHAGYDYKMVYFNADGRQSTMCGNGGRCFAQYLRDSGMVRKNEISFLAVDGPHDAIMDTEFQRVYLKMSDVSGIEKITTGNNTAYVLNTGSPHYVIPYTEDLAQLQIVDQARKIRYNDRFAAEGINVNFFKHIDQHIAVRTYERGVEDETLSCGTGVTAVAIVTGYDAAPGKHTVHISTPGGHLQVKFNKADTHQYNDIWLIGPATPVFSGELKL